MRERSHERPRVPQTLAEAQQREVTEAIAALVQTYLPGARTTTRMHGESRVLSAMAGTLTWPVGDGAAPVAIKRLEHLEDWIDAHVSEAITLGRLASRAGRRPLAATLVPRAARHVTNAVRFASGALPRPSVDCSGPGRTKMSRRSPPASASRTSGASPVPTARRLVNRRRGRWRVAAARSMCAVRPLPPATPPDNKHTATTVGRTGRVALAEDFPLPEIVREGSRSLYTSITRGCCTSCKRLIRLAGVERLTWVSIPITRSNKSNVLKGPSGALRHLRPGSAGMVPTATPAINRLACRLTLCVISSLRDQELPLRGYAALFRDRQVEEVCVDRNRCGAQTLDARCYAHP